MEIRKLAVDGRDNLGPRRIYAVTPPTTDPATASQHVSVAFGERVTDWTAAYVKEPDGTQMMGEIRTSPFAGSRLALVAEVRS